MHKAFKDSPRQSGGGGAGGTPRRITYVKPEFRKKEYVFPGITWQEWGYLTSALWNTRDQIIRIIPGYDPETKEIYRQNINVNDFAEESDYTDYLSDTFMMTDTMQNFGEAHSSFVSSYAPGSAEEQEYGSDTVMRVFSNNVYWTTNPKKTSKPRFGCIPEMHRWVALREGTLPRCHRSLLVQALIYKLNGEGLTDENKQPLLTEDGQLVPKIGVVAIEGASTLQAVLRALVEPKDPGQPLDACLNNKYGGFAELNGNKMYLNAAVTPEKGYKYLNPSVHEAKAKGWTLDMCPLTEEDVYNWWMPWDDLIYYMTPVQQAEVLAAEFGADAVNYLVGTDPIYRNFTMPDSIAKAGYGRFSQFTDGVKEVRTSGTVAVPASGVASPSVGKPATSLAAAFGPAKKPAGLSARPSAPVANRGPVIPKNSGVDQSPNSAFSAALGQIRRASAQAPQEEDTGMEDLANDLSQDGFEDYEDDQQ